MDDLERDRDKFLKEFEQMSPKDQRYQLALPSSGQRYPLDSSLGRIDILRALG
jgi:hypothetical protein